MAQPAFLWPDVDASLSRDSTWSTITELETDPDQLPAPGGWVEEERGAPGDVIPATAAFTVSPSPATVSEVVTVDAGTSVQGTYPIKTFSWDFGDSGPAITGQTMTHSYAIAGDYTITLTITDAAGGTAQT